MKELRDQAAHAAWAIISLAPVILAPNPVTGAWAGFAIGLVREVTEEGELSLDAVRRALGSVRDLLGWSAGGAIIGLIGLVA
jgi:hypothetical protein